MVADHDQSSAVGFDDRDRSGVTDDILDDGTVLGRPLPAFHGEDRTHVRDGDLRWFLHMRHHREYMSSTTPTQPGGESLVSVRGLRKSFGPKQVLRGIDIDFPPHRTTVVLGPSGCGKSVLLKHLVGLLRPDEGSVHFDGNRIDTMPEREMTPIRRQFGFLFQMGALFDSLTVNENIAFPLHEAGVHDETECTRRVAEVLAMVGLEECSGMMPADLSGGQRKRIALARSIVLRPRVILYDEPTTGLDPIRSDVINELIIKLQQELEATSIVVTHDLTSASRSPTTWCSCWTDGSCSRARRNGSAIPSTRRSPASCRGAPRNRNSRRRGSSKPVERANEMAGTS